jgi:hypothetical protein
MGFMICQRSEEVGFTNIFTEQDCSDRSKLEVPGTVGEGAMLPD